VYVGLDIHKRACYGTIRDQDGNVLKRGKFASNPEDLTTFIKGIDETQIAMEAGYCWQPLYDALKEKGYDVQLAHPKRVKAIAEAKVKTDKVSTPGPSPGCSAPTCCQPVRAQRGAEEQEGAPTPPHQARDGEDGDEEPDPQPPRQA